MNCPECLRQSPNMRLKLAGAPKEGRLALPRPRAFLSAAPRPGVGGRVARSLRAIRSAAVDSKGPRMEYPHPITARLWEPIEPINRGERYEDPLQSALQAQRLGSVDGGGSQLTELGEVLFAELAIHLANLDEALAMTKRVLEEAGAPRGSELRFRNDSGRPPMKFGTQECLAIYLDGVSLPQEVYAALDLAAVVKQVEDALGLGGKALRGSWGGSEETSLYFYGPDADSMFAQVESLLRRLPICQNARVVLRHGNPELQPRTVRLPRATA